MLTRHARLYVLLRFASHTISIFATLALFLSIDPLLRAQAVPQGIRAVDFKNFAYPFTPPSHYPDHLQWMSLRLKNQVRLVDGIYDDRDQSEKASHRPFVGLAFDAVGYATLSDSHSENAIVILRYATGGTQSHYWVYIYDFRDGKPNLIAYFHAGDRANQGLHQVYGKKGILNVELYDPARQQGACCSSGYLRYQFRWNGQGFESLGAPTKAMQ